MVLMVVAMAVAVEVVAVWRVLLVQPRRVLVVHVWWLRREVVGLRLVQHGRGQQGKRRLGHAPRVPPCELFHWNASNELVMCVECWS